MKNHMNSKGEKSRAKPKIIMFSVLLFGLFTANAQQATGSVGNASYSIGEVAYTSQTGSTGTVT